MTNRTPAKKAVLVGIDALVPSLVRKFVAEGRMPHLKQLQERGFTTEVVPTLPAWTPNGWASIATGANSSTHGIEGFLVHLPGESFTTYHNGFDSRLYKAERFWEAAANADKKSILLKYPGTWPPRPHRNVTQVGGIAGYAGIQNDHDISRAHCFTTDPNIPRAKHITLAPATDWQNLPAMTGEPLEARFEVELRPSVELGTYDGATGRSQFERQVHTYYGLIYPSGSSGYDRLMITSAKDAGQVVTTLSAGQWSDWIFDTYSVGDETRTGSFKFRLVQLSEDGQQFKLFMTQNHPFPLLKEYTVPGEVAEQLTEQVGPIFEDTFPFYRLWGWIDDQSHLEIYEQHVDWLKRSAQYLLQNYEWDIFVTQLHILDYAEHIWLGPTDPSHPEYDSQYDPVAWEALAKSYELADSYIGAIADRLDDDSLLLITGDHGQVPCHYNFFLNDLLRQEGLLEVIENPETGYLEIDWSRTKAYAYEAVYVFVNLAGRDPGGIVQPGAEYEEVRARVIELLCGVKHPETGQPVVRIAAKREDMLGFGLYGDGVGDIIYCTHPPFDTGIPLRQQYPEYEAGVSETGQVFFLSRLGTEMTGEHQAFFPHDQDVRTLSVMAGPGIKRNVTRRVPVSITDIAPTFCSLAGLPFPAETEGSVILDVHRDSGSSPEVNQ